METIDAQQREALIAELAKPRRRHVTLRRPVAKELLALAATIDVAKLPFLRPGRSLPWVHETNCRHFTYHLTCSEFDMLEREADGFCDICGRDLRHYGDTPHIDHDHAIGWRAVRGLLCRACNARLANVDLGQREPSRAMRYYLDNPWHARVGLEPLICPSECGQAAHRTGWRDA